MSYLQDILVFLFCSIFVMTAAVSAQSLGDRCEAGNAVACRELGYKLYNGEGVRQDRRTAVRLYEKACELDDAEACGAAGASYFLGEVVEQDFVQAVQYMNEACKGKIAKSCFGAGVLFDEGKVKLNNDDPFYNEEDQAGYFYMKACDYDFAEGCNQYGVHLLREGEGDLAPMQFRKACDGGSKAGCQNLRDVCAGHTYPPSGCPRW